MTTDNQQAVLDFLMTPAAHGGATVERIDTHSAVVFLAGPRALKLKRAVRFDYLDFSTEPLRRAACEAEVRINRRTAPMLYRGMVAVTREANGSLALNGAGTPVDWLVEMVRFSQDGLLDRLAARDALDLSLMRPLAAAIAEFHMAAARRSDHGGRAGVAWVVDGNEEGFRNEGAGILDPRVAAELTASARLELQRQASLLDRRRSDGLVRQCHGDLHLRNIVLLDDTPTLFDAIEFNDRIACVDVLYDLAFLLMDLWKRRLPGHANAVLNGYLAETGDLEGLSLVPLFLSCRAAVRAKTSATAARVQPDPQRTRELEALAREYLDMASHLLARVPPRLVAVGGLSGSGQSTLARALAPSVGGPPGAVVVRSDEIRKSLCGVGLLEHLGDDAYTAEMTARVYEALIERARVALLAGWSVVVDAVWARLSDRATVEALAASTSAPFLGIWLEAPQDVLIGRAERRGPDASDADAAVVRLQHAQDHGVVRWRRLDASPGPETVLEQARVLMDAGRVG
ncbi:MAG: AAA family ATPase [Acidobacteria bacterium]|nr:AAA family ATPase [Acidobacteriota bacterium]